VDARNAAIAILSGIVLMTLAAGSARAALTALTAKGGLSVSTLTGSLPTDPLVGHDWRRGWGGGTTARNGDLLVMAGVALHP